MALNVGINGFGRMGRLTLRAAWGGPTMRFVQINDPAGDAATLAHLLNFDSVHGRWDARGHRRRRRDCHRRPAHPADAQQGPSPATDWSGCDVVIEASGKFRKPDVLQPYLDQGVKRVVVTAPVKEAGTLDIVMGVNDQPLRSGASTASCRRRPAPPTAWRRWSRSSTKTSASATAA